jgi:hypothetical protein
MSEPDLRDVVEIVYLLIDLFTIFDTAQDFQRSIWTQ